jgi:peroxiredoxin Q/BCP
MKRLQPGDPAPAFDAANQNGDHVKLADFNGCRLFVFFYPKANTSG